MAQFFCLQNGKKRMFYFFIYNIKSDAPLRDASPGIII